MISVMNFLVNKINICFLISDIIIWYRHLQ
jgi:hypothetical protein